jgi:CDGSH-type Zn-finger protein
MTSLGDKPINRIGYGAMQLAGPGVHPSEDGPLLVSGPAVLIAPDGRVIEHPDPMSICRCGGSSNKPFCDGTHATIDFDGTLAN